MNTEITNALKATSDTAQYDNSAKRLLGNKYIFGADTGLFIRQSTTPEVFRTWVNAVIFLFPGHECTALLLLPNVH